MAASLQDLTYFLNRNLGGVDEGEVNSERGRNALEALRQYDPSASWHEVTGSDGQRLGYALDFDASKLPNFSGTGKMPGTGGSSYQDGFSFSTVQPNMQLTDPNAVTTSPDYGQITRNTNIEQPSSALDYLGPLGVAAFAFGIPYLASAMSGGALGAGAAGAAGAGGAAGGAVDTTGFQIPGGASGAFNAAVGGGAPAAALPGFQIPGGAAGMFGVAGSGISPSTAAILSDIGSPSLFDVGGAAGQALAGNATAPMPGGSVPSGGGSGFKLPSVGDVVSAISKIPSIGGAGAGGTGGGGGAGLLNLPPSQYGSLANIVKKYYGGLLG